MVRLREKLARAVRNSLNLPSLRVRVRQNRGRKSWSVRLYKEGAISDWLELNAESMGIVKKIGLLPAIHLGMFRLAYAALQEATEPGEPSTAQQRQRL